MRINFQKYFPAIVSTINAGNPSWESSWGPSWSPSWLEHCQQACLLCGPIPFDPLCDCQQIFGVRCSPPISSEQPSLSYISIESSTEPESVSEGS